MKLSFIIVALNSEKALDNSLSSLVKQDYPHNEIEVILVDGLSTDGTKHKMLDFQKNETSFDRVVVKDNPGKYLAGGWNVALKEVTGKVVLRVDAHTEFPEDFISKNIKCILGGESICGGRVLSILEDNSQMNRVMLEAENSMFGGGFTFFRRGEVRKYTNTLAFAAYKKEVFDAVGPYNERLVRTEDNDIHYRMQQAGYKFYFNPEIVSYRYCRSTFSKLVRQKYLNGYWVGLTMGVQPKAFSVFYFVPLLFVLGLLFFGALSFISVWPLVVYVGVYAFVLILSFIAAIAKSGFYPALLLLPFILLSLHVGYGVGTIKGLVMIPTWLKQKYHNRDMQDVRCVHTGIF